MTSTIIPPASPGINIKELPTYLNYKSRIVNIGDVAIGGDLPIAVQSMTNTFTMDTAATVAQVIRLAEAGSRLVRIASQNPREAENLYAIKRELLKRGCKVPLIADIHYQPKAAEIAARIVEKVRINPGNYFEKRKSMKTEFSEKEYTEDLEKIAEKLNPLLSICKEYGTAIRIGTNHGSLSGRILSRYGDTPVGMVESAMEFLRICDAFGFHNLVLSMKSSNIRVMIQATRLLVARMKSEKMDYPIHLGVTEAGDGEDGRIKSAAGIGTLLTEGIGDTIRVSLTEDPVNEIPFAQALVKPYNINNSRKHSDITYPALHPYHYKKFLTNSSGKIGGGQVPVIVGQDISADDLTSLQGVNLFQPSGNNFLDDLRKYFMSLEKKGDVNPVILKVAYKEDDIESLLIRLSSDLAGALTDGLGDGVWIDPGHKTDPSEFMKILFGILQACGTRITKAEFISCPSCGRTKFDIQDTLQRIKTATGHLAGIKIAVMGCIVNGPGEMADSDYGYVGSGPGKVTLYKKQQVVKRNVDEAVAVETLVALMREGGDWRKGPD
jgi:(E)-4-hydroxy-3-methylbut-2-enyl-diphosphate synthase